MNAQILRELGGDIPLLTQGQLRFLDDVQLVVENRFMGDDYAHLPDDEERVIEIMEKVSAVEENLRTIIGRLRGGRSARDKFLKTYPKWKKVREDGIEKLREISQSIQTDRFNCNVSKLTGYCTSFVGGALTLTSAVLLPLTAGASTPLVAAGVSLTAAGCSTAVGTSITEAVLLKTKVNNAQGIIEEDKKLFQEMNSWLDHAAKLEEALSEILKIDIVKDIVDGVKDLVDRGIRMKDDYTRLNYIERGINVIMTMLPPNIEQAIPVLAVVTIISVLVTVFLLLLNTENRLVFDCASLTIRSIVGVASLADDAFDLARFGSLFTSNAVLAKDLAKAVTRGAVAVLGMALDVAGIALTSVDIHKGSQSPEAVKIAEAADDLKEESMTLEKIYDNINQVHPTTPSSS